MLQEDAGALSGVNQSSSVDPRRRALVLGAAGAALAQLTACGGGHDNMMGQAIVPPLIDADAAVAPPRPLPIIPMDQGLDDGSGGRTFSLVAQRGSAQLLSGVTTNTLGYNGAVLGPALRLSSIRVL